MSKSTILLLALGTLLILGGGVYVWQQRSVLVPAPAPTSNTPPEVTEPAPTPTPETLINTSDWQTYRNEKYGFEFKYPKEWETRNLYADPGKGFSIWFSEKGKWYKSEGGEWNAIILSLSLKSNPKYKSPESTLETWKKYYAISIGQSNYHDTVLYWYSGFGTGAMTASDVKRNFDISISSNLLMSAYPEVKTTLTGMVQSLIIKK